MIVCWFSRFGQISRFLKAPGYADVIFEPMEPINPFSNVGLALGGPPLMRMRVIGRYLEAGGMPMITTGAPS